MNKKSSSLFVLGFLTIVLTACQPETPTTSAVETEVTLNTTEVTVYKSSTCGCCKEWVTYLEEEGYQVSAIDHDDMDSIKVKLGLPDPGLHSCHTALVDGYVIEGHVPVADIERLLREKPTDVKGLSAPGMPMKSPGMGSRIPQDYAVLSFSESGETKVYSEY